MRKGNLAKKHFFFCGPSGPDPVVTGIMGDCECVKKGKLFMTAAEQLVKIVESRDMVLQQNDNCLRCVA